MRSLAPLLCLPLAACVSVVDDNPALSDGTRVTSTLPMVEPPSPSAVASISGLSREHWAETSFNVPQRDVVHQPIYRSRPTRFTDTTATQRGDYPQPQTAGEGAMGRSDADQRLEALAAPFMALADVALFLPRAVMMPPTSPVCGPLLPVDRVPPRSPDNQPAAPAPLVPPAQSGTPTPTPGAAQ